MAKKNEKLARAARLACEKWRERFKHNIDQYHEMHTFVLGQQWTDDEEDMLKSFRKVPLVSNKLGVMANSLLGEQQQNTPQIQVVPMENCDEETAHLRELITKDIMFSTDATLAYQVSAMQAAIGGYSAFLWDTEYANKKSFDQEPACRYFKDATRTYFDLGAETVNKTDGDRCGYYSRMSRTKFRQIYGKDLEEKISKGGTTQTKEEIALAVQPSDGDDPFTWDDQESITIIHDYVRKYYKAFIYKLSNGKTIEQEEMDDMVDKSRRINQQSSILDMAGVDDMGMEAMDDDTEGLPEGADVEDDTPVEEEDLELMTLWDDGEIVRIEEKRQVKRSKIRHNQIAGDYSLEEEEFPADRLPLIFMDQNSYYDKSGKQICRSFFGDCKDTQRYINYLRTQSAYIIKISRYDQFMGSKKNVASLDTQRNWRDPNNTQGLLAYDESPSGAKPEQIRPPELSQSLLTQYQLAVEDLYTSTGLYPTRLGEAGNEVSGKAIDARTRQGSYPTFIFYNSINRAIAAGGEVLNDMIPRVYDAERVIALMTPDEGMKNITINRQADEYGEHIENDIRKGTYEVRLKPGPSYEGQKQEALQSLKEILAVDPQAFALVADLYADNLPLANNIEIKNRLKTLVPPGIVEAGKTGKMPDDQNGQPSPQEQAMQAEMAIQQKTLQLKEQEVQIKAQEYELKRQEIMMEAQFKLQELETERIETAGRLKEQELRYMAETERTNTDREIAQTDSLVKLMTHKMSMDTKQNTIREGSYGNRDKQY